MIYDIVIHQGHEGKMQPFYFPHDYSSWSITAQFKTTQSLSASTVFEKKNATAGGNDDQLVASYANGATKVEPILLYTDTNTITADYGYFEIVAEKGTNRDILYSQKVKIKKAIIEDGGVQSYMVANSHTFVFKVTSPSTVSLIQDSKGFTTALDANSVSVSGDIITITSSGEFTDDFEVRNNKGIQQDWYVDTNTYKVQLAGNWGTDIGSVRIELFNYKVTSS